MPGDKDFSGFGKTKKPHRIEDSFLNSEENPHNYYWEELQSKYGDKRQDLDDWLMSLDTQVAKDIEDALQKVSDQKSLLFGLSSDEMKGKNLDLTPLFELKEKYKSDPKIIDFIENKAFPLISGDMGKEFGIAVDVSTQQEVFQENYLNREVSMEATDAEEFLNDFFEHKLAGTGKDTWIWQKTLGPYINMGAPVSSIGEQFVSLYEHFNYSSKSTAFTGGDKLIKFLKGKKIVGVSVDGAFFLKVIE